MPPLDIPSQEIAQFEKQLLYHDLKRNSFRARSATKEFVLNPIYDTEHLLEENSPSVLNGNFHNNQERGESVEGDSGVDSFSSLSTFYEPKYNSRFEARDFKYKLNSKNNIKRSSSLQLRDLASLW